MLHQLARPSRHLSVSPQANQNPSTTTLDRFREGQWYTDPGRSIMNFATPKDVFAIPPDWTLLHTEISSNQTAPKAKQVATVENGPTGTHFNEKRDDIGRGRDNACLDETHYHIVHARLCYEPWDQNRAASARGRGRLLPIHMHVPDLPKEFCQVGSALLNFQNPA